MSAVALPARRRLDRSTLALTLLCLAQFVLILDAAVVAVALPAIQADLGLTPSQLQAMSAAYAVTFGGLLILAGRVADLYGARRSFVAGLSLFTVASLACALAPSGGVLIAARAAQGVGGALASPAALALLLAAFHEEAARTRAFAAWGAVAAAGAVAGQIIGGVLTEALDWRWIFLINLPIGAIVLAAAPRLLAAPPASSRPVRLDLPGATLLTATVVLLVFAATRATSHGVDDGVVALGLVGTAALAWFLAHERRAPEPLLRPRFLARPHVWHGNAVAFLAAGASTTVVFFCAIYLQRALELSTLEVGLGFAPVTAAIIAVSGFTARLTARFGLPAILGAGQLLVAAGAIALSFVSPGGSYLVDALPGLALVGIGSGLTYGPAMTAATAGIDPGEHGVATGVVTTMQQLGAALGLAVLTTVAFRGHGGDPTVLADASLLADGFRAVIALPVSAALIAIHLSTRPIPK